VAVLTVIFGFIARKANDIVQAIFGWSVTALFGRLPRRAQVMVTGALLLSLAWPVFVIGVFAPGVSAWAIAMVPLHAWLGATVMRALWIALAIIAPPLVGLLVYGATPRSKGGPARAALHGYPTALGFFAAFMVVVVTVPIIKIASIARRWTDEHVYLQPHDGHYDEVVRALADAAGRAGVIPEISDAPRHMVLATTIMRTLAKGLVSPFVTNTLRRVTADGLVVYLYPADLLIRGVPTTVAKMRAMFGRTQLDAHAYLVASPEAQHIQDELAKLNQALLDGEERRRLDARLRLCYAEILRIDTTYDEWVILDLMARRLERKLSGLRFPLDGVTPRAAETLGRSDGRSEAAHAR
jgi:hypothetical protein